MDKVHGFQCPKCGEIISVSDVQVEAILEARLMAIRKEEQSRREYEERQHAEEARRLLEQERLKKKIVEVQDSLVCVRKELAEVESQLAEVGKGKTDTDDHENEMLIKMRMALECELHSQQCVLDYLGCQLAELRAQREKAF